MLYLTLAFISGIPALVYQVAWTRELGLLAGSQVEGVSAVLAVFFGGLALGTWRLSPLADRAENPLRLYALLEGGAAVLAAATPFAIRALGSLPVESDAVRLAAGAALLLPGTFLLGGTLPALLRSRPVDVAGVAARAGWLTGANTAGAVTGVVVSALCIPRLGLRDSVLGAAVVAVGIAAAAAAASSARQRTPAAD
ncbi:MAG: spermidine synthase, partial [Deltaproteobacteria bacterium]|nr:spermidine synthase [Deltaproteobacteria bacterium]